MIANLGVDGKREINWRCALGEFDHVAARCIDHDLLAKDIVDYDLDAGAYVPRFFVDVLADAGQHGIHAFGDTMGP